MRILNLNENAQSQTASFDELRKEDCEGAAKVNEQVYARIQTACVRTAVYMGACSIPWIRDMLKLKVYYVLRTAAVLLAVRRPQLLPSAVSSQKHHKNRISNFEAKQDKNSTSSLYVLTCYYVQQ